MPRPSLATTLHNTTSSVDYLAYHRTQSKELHSTYQYFIAEMIMLRLFAILENAIAEVAYKLVAGAPYLNGKHPKRCFVANSITGARAAMLTHGRAKPRQNLSWTKATYIRESTSNVLPESEPYIASSRAHGNILDEMRKVRNYAAHRNATSRKEYRQVVRASCGANAQLSIGAFLVSQQRWPISKVDYYLTTSKIMINDLVSG